MDEQDNSKGKKPKKSLKLLWIIPAVILGFILLVVFIDSMDTPSGQVTKSICRDVEVPYEEQEEYMKTEYYTETVPYTDRECESKQLVYRSTEDQLNTDVVCIEDHKVCKESHKNFWGNIVCDREETVCDTYRETASFSITNLDSENGWWHFEWRSTCRSNQPLCTSNSFETLTNYGISLQPTETKTDTYSITYDAKGQKYLYAYFTSIPTKQVCRDVTKYKEVQRERQVTAYRPVTKYKTEQKCD